MPFEFEPALMSHWSERAEGGNRFWLKLIRWVILHVGRGFTRFWMFPTAMYFFLRRGPERRSSRAWLSRARGRPAGQRHVLRHIFVFAMTIVDRVLLLAGREDRLDIRAEGHLRLHETLREGQGCLLLGSHLGSFEASRVFARRVPEFRLRVVMDRQQNALMMRLMEELDPAIAGTVIEARQPGLAIALAVSEALSEGAMVALLADRGHRGEATVQVPFMGEMAHFPTAPIRIAAALDVPVFLVFGLFEGGRRYRLVFEHFAERVEIARGKGRQARLSEWVARYAGRLEHYAKMYPYNWFNFYDFWAANTDDDAGDGPGRRGTGRRS